MTSCSNCGRSVESTNEKGLCPSCAGEEISFSPAFMARWEKAEWRRTAREGLAAVRCSCGDLIGYTMEAGLTQSGAICGNCAAGRADRDLIEEARDLLLQFHEPDAGEKEK